ncbi:hypothetical protein THRCLA_05555 [Thraustotheca clavata]|uniref:Cyclin-like domain-containing protein n=1 Tax=Thraustotheca clavata TaxID=74557 RepID=A0A1V9ZVK4_9STRA|nr:hypothetical protein THRCLA_05555 [Thraustotheca clavata]
MDLNCLEDVPETINSSLSSAIGDSYEMLGHLMQREISTAPNPFYLLNQADGITEASRSHICSWICEVAQEFEFSNLTTAFAINYLDRYLTHYSTTQHRLQLVALVAILIASKFQENDGISMEEAKEIASNVFTVGDIKRMERDMLGALEWKLHAVVPIMYIERILDDLDQTHHLSAVCDEIVSLHQATYNQLQFSSSIVAISILRIAYDLHGLCSSLLSEYLSKMNLSLNTNECQEQLQLILPSHLTKKKKRERSPSPSSVDEDITTITTPHMTEIKRQKSC